MSYYNPYEIADIFGTASQSKARTPFIMAVAILPVPIKPSIDYASSGISDVQLGHFTALMLISL